MADRWDQPGLIGREAELQRLRAQLDNLSGGSVILLLGPAGIGKSTLLRAVTQWCAQQGARVGWGVVDEWGGAAPMWPWYEAMTGIDPHQAVMASGGQEVDAVDKVELFRQVAQWLGSVCKHGQVVVALEDMHMAHPTAVELLQYLSRRPLPPGVSILVTARPGSSKLEELRCPQILLQGFSPAQVQSMAETMSSPIDRASAESLVRRTSGNPLFVQRLLEQGLTGQHDQALPSDVVTLLRLQLGDAAPEARPLLDALAVLGATDIELLERVAGVRAGQARAALTPNLVILDGSTVSVRHGLLRELLYDELSTARRFQLHANAADALRDDGAGPIVLAHHLARAAASHRTQAAADAAWQAARIEWSMGALLESAEHFGLAVSILTELDLPLQLAEAIVDEATVLGQLGRISEAEAKLQHVANLNSDLPQHLRRRVIREYRRLRWREEPNPSRLNARSLERLAQQWLADSPDAQDQAMFHAAMVSVGEIRGQEPSDLDAGDRAVAAAVDIDDPVLAAEAHLARRRALTCTPHRLEERRRDSEAAVKLAGQTRDIELIQRAERHALCDALAAGDRERAQGLLDSTPLSASAREQLALGRAGNAALEGRYEDATEILDDAAKELSYLGVNTPALDFIRIAHSWDIGQLNDTLAEFEPLLPAIADPALRGAVAMAKVMTGDYDVANTLVTEALDTLTSETPTLVWTSAISLVAESAIAIHHPRLPEVADMLSRFGGQCSTSAAAAVPWVGSFDRLIGLLHLRTGELDLAIERIEASLAVHKRMHAEPWVARSLAALAQANRQLGDGNAARLADQQANEIAQRLGMSPDVLLVGRWQRTATEGSTDVAIDLRDQADAARTGTFERDGAVWALALGAESCRVASSTGMDYLALLLGQPEVDWHVLDLYSAAAGTASVVQGHGGAVLDDAARRAYQERYLELSTQLDQAADDADLGAADSIREEIELLEHQLLSAFGLSGRPRTMDDPTERARVNVRRAITRAFNRIGEHAPALADHLRHSVSTGRFCRYSPDANAVVSWNTRTATPQPPSG